MIIRLLVLLLMAVVVSVIELWSWSLSHFTVLRY
jgi:hypothetical protein